MVSWLVKWGAKKGTKKVAETITSLKGKYNIGSADKIKKKSIKIKYESDAEKRKKAMTRYFTNQPPKPAHYQIVRKTKAHEATANL